MQDWKNAGPSTCLTIVMIIKLINTFHVMNSFTYAICQSPAEYYY